MKYLLAIFLLITTLVAEQNYSLRFAYGKASQNDLGEILLADLGTHPISLKVYAFDGGYFLSKPYEHISLYLKGGLSYFDDNYADDVYEGTLYIKAYWDIPYFKESVRFGFGEGGSYVSHVLLCEYLEATQKNDNNSKYLNYLDISLDFDIGRVFGSKSLENLYLGYAIKHRSGIFGLINNVAHGGSNYNTLYIEKNF